MDELLRLQQRCDLCQELAHRVAQVREKTVAKVVCKSRLSVLIQPVSENTASTVGSLEQSQKTNDEVHRVFSLPPNKHQGIKSLCEKKKKIF